MIGKIKAWFRRRIMGEVSPGVTVEEIEIPEATPIRPPTCEIDMGITTCLGQFEKGPVNEPVLVTSFEDFTEKFGGKRVEPSSLAEEIYEFFKGGGSRIQVIRCLPRGRRR